MTECLSALSVVGIVILAFLIMTRIVTVQDAAKAIAQAFLVILLPILAIGLLRSLVPPAVVTLGDLASWLALIAFAIIGIGVVAWIGRWALTHSKKLSGRENRNE